MSVYNWPRGARFVVVESDGKLALEVHTGRTSYSEASVVVSKREALKLARTLLNFALTGKAVRHER